MIAKGDKFRKEVLVNIDYSAVQLSKWTSDAHKNELIQQLVLNYLKKYNIMDAELKRKKFAITIGDELPSGIIQLAKVYITGNTANSCGGGIGSDGDVIIGTPGAWLPFTGNSGLGFVEFLGVAVLAAGAVALYRNRREWDFPAPKGGDCDE